MSARETAELLLLVGRLVQTEDGTGPRSSPAEVSVAGKVRLAPATPNLNC
jgi:hypothetical protein